MSAAGFFDLHTQLLLRDGWAGLVSGETPTFTTLFPGIDAALVTEWLDKLAPVVSGVRDPLKLEIRPAFVPEITNLPCIIIQYLDEPEDEAPMGYLTSSDTDTGRKFGMLLRQTVQIHIMTPHPELARALHVAILATMLTNRDWFVENGYCDLEYQGGGDLQAQQDLVPEFLGAYVRTQRYTARADFEVSGETFKVYKVYVASTATAVDGNIGGVDTT